MINEELFTSTLATVCEIIAAESGNEIEEILPDMHLEDELEIAETDLRRLIKVLNGHFGVELDPAVIEEEESVTTVRELATIIAEEIELG